MDQARRASRRSQADYPKPESDLAEWATKIKALQRQVDADEEVEQKRLEAEIAAARQARLRRSRQFSGRGPTVEGSPSSEQWNLASSTTDSFSVDRLQDGAERYGHQNEALKKLIGQNAVHVPDKTPTAPISLASFIGGHATGPRLNKHAAQQDAHDPTQFTQPVTSAPHPIFGKGGVAMPGMMSKQDLNGGRIQSKPGYSSSPTSIPTPRDQSSTLHTPATAERRRSISPTPAVGTEDFERYRPSVSPTPKSPLKSKKSSEGIREASGKDAQPYRYSITGHSSLRSQKSSERVASPRLRSQKSSDRISTPVVGSEDFERYRPSTSPQPTLKSQKSSGNFSHPEPSEKQRPLSGSLASNLRPVTPSKTYGRISPDKRPVSPDKSVHRSQGYEPLKSPAPEPKNKKSWSQATTKSSTPILPVGNDRTSSSLSRQADTRTPAISTPKPVSYLSSAKDSLSTSSSRERTISSPSYLPKGPVFSHQTGKTTVVSPPPLARPIQPEARLPAHVPVLPPAAVVPSPAFKKQETAKDLSPSISRLQGRGFVQNMVKASLRLETQSPPSSVHSTPVDKTRQPNGGKKSVLDRWQPQLHSPSPPPSPTKPQNTVPVRRAATTDPSVANITEQRVNAGSPALVIPSLQASRSKTPTAITSPSLQAKTPPAAQEAPLTPRSTAQLMEKMTPSSGNIGSATTMFVEKPAFSSPSVSAVDELGVKREIPRSRLVTRDDNKDHIASEIPAPTGKPLIHPTKNRAKKRKKSSIPGSITAILTEEPEEIPLRSNEKSAHGSRPAENVPSSISNLRLDSKIGRLTESWSAAGPIVTRPDDGPLSDHSSPAPKLKRYPGLRQALPGMVKDSPLRPRTPDMRESPPSTNTQADKVHVPNSPSRHTRIPSTGNRATVMEVAQALQELTQSEETLEAETNRSAKASRDETEEHTPQLRLRPPPTSPNIERRRSSYDRFSVITLPPLKEEATPNPSPAGTLTRAKEFISSPEEAVTSHEAPAKKERSTNTLETENIHIEHNDSWGSLPKVDISVMSQPISSSSLISPDSKTISVDLMSITGSSSTALTKDTDIFYDTEVLSIVHRSKSQSNGLVDTFVWCWLGRRAQYDEAEEKKLHEIARRYGTTPVIIRQCSEPDHLIHLVGGRLAIRQGSRAHWNPENTAMHLIRSIRGVIVIDEHDLNIKNLCSAFSYCVTILNTVYVWHGCGSTSVERDAAMKYAELLANGDSVTELYEGREDNQDFMFWMILGSDSFANADYWKWRGSTPSIDPTIWRVDASKKVNTLVPVEFFSQISNPCELVYVANCVWELFVLVGPDARGSRTDIRLALDVALRFAQKVSSERPFTPNVHVVIFPSQLPLDLRLHFRDLDESTLNHGDIPDHMNLVSSDKALEHLQSTFWLPTTLKDESMLPLGIDVTHSIGPST